MAILESIKNDLPIEEQYHEAYKAVSRWLYSNRLSHLTQTAMRVAYLEDISGEIVSVNERIAEIIDRTGYYIPRPEAQIANNQWTKILRAVLTELTEKQKRVLHYRAIGYSLKQTANALGIASGTVCEHLRAIQSKAAKHIA